MTGVFTLPAGSWRSPGKYVPSPDKYLPAASLFFPSAVLLVHEKDVLGRAGDKAGRKAARRTQGVDYYVIWTGQAIIGRWEGRAYARGCWNGWNEDRSEWRTRNVGGKKQKESEKKGKGVY